MKGWALLFFKVNAMGKCGGVLGCYCPLPLIKTYVWFTIFHTTRHFFYPNTCMFTHNHWLLPSCRRWGWYVIQPWSLEEAPNTSRRVGQSSALSYVSLSITLQQSDSTQRSLQGSQGQTVKVRLVTNYMHHTQCHTEAAPGHSVQGAPCYGESLMRVCWRYWSAPWQRNHSGKRIQYVTVLSQMLEGKLVNKKTRGNAYRCCGQKVKVIVIYSVHTSLLCHNYNSLQPIEIRLYTQVRTKKGRHLCMLWGNGQKSRPYRHNYSVYTLLKLDNS